MVEVSRGVPYSSAVPLAAVRVPALSLVPTMSPWRLASW
jgi:hypothetical protein